MDPTEATFVLSDEEGTDDTTRVLVHLRVAPVVSKERLRALPEFVDHQILRGPMGTVFPMSDDQWSALSSLLPPPPDTIGEIRSALPPVFAWQQRAKGVLPMPGGYDGYLATLAKVCAMVDEERPSAPELPGLLERELGVRTTAARLRESFLRKVGIVVVQDGICRVGSWARRWHESDDDRVVIALLHSRCQLVGELLAVACEPRTTEEMLVIANEKYRMGWDTQTQILNRRGWLQSARMLSVNEDGRVETTTMGRELLAELTLYDPSLPPVSSPSPSPPPAQTTPLLAPDDVEVLIQELLEASVDSKNPDRFEKITRNAFALLGFHAEWMGGSGKTDVLLDASLGKADTYRAIVDCKTSASGSVGDQQVDWVTLGDHRLKHDAQYVVLVAPNPTGARLLERAEQHAVAVIPVGQLAGLCRQHVKTPLGLADYKSMFERGGLVDTQYVDERAADAARILTLALACTDAIRSRATEFGRLSARDLFLLLANDPVAEGTSEDEIQDLLATLSSSLLGMLDGDAQIGYRVTSSASVFAARIEIIAQQLNREARVG
jgi:hypothetical protein